MIGTVIQVNADPVRSFLAGPAAASDTSLLVDDVAPFAMPGAQVSIEGQVYDVVSTLPSTVTDEPDVLVIEPGLLVDVEEGEPVDLHPEIFHTHAVVEFPDGHIESEVLVDQDYQAQKGLAPGSYEGDARPVVTMEFRDGQHVIVGVDGRGEIDGRNVIPDPDWPSGEVDPVAPGYSPEVTATGGPGSVALSWLAVPDAGAAGVRYDVETSEVGADDWTLLGSTDSTGWLIFPANGSRDFRVWARSLDLYADDPSAVVEGAPDADAASILVTGGVYATQHIQVGDSSGAHMGIWDELGLVGYGAGGASESPTTQIDPETGLLSAIGARIKGLIEATSAVLQSFTLRGAGRLDSGSSLTVGAGIVAPTQPASAERYWPSAATSLAGDFSDWYRGLVLNAAGTKWISIAALAGGRGASFNLDGTADGVPYDLFPDWLPDGGITRIGSDFYALGVGINGGPRDGRWFVKRLNSSLQETGEWEWVPSSARSHRPAIGTDGTSVVIAWRNSSQTVVRQYNPTTGAQLSAAFSWNHGANATDVTSVHWGTGDLGSNVIASYRRSVSAHTVTGTRVTSAEWQLAGSANLLGMGHDGDRFRHLDIDGRMWTYSTLTADAARDIDYSWYDSDPAGAGVHETDRGPVFAYTQVARSWLRVTTGTPYDTGEDDAPDSVRIWINGQRQPDLGPGVTTAEYEIPATGTTTKAPSFASAGLSAGSIASEIQAGGTGWGGNGSGRFWVRTPQADDEAANREFVELHTGPWAELTLPSSQSLTPGTSETEYTWLTLSDSENASGIYSVSGNRVTVLQTGLYVIEGTAHYGANSSSNRYVKIRDLSNATYGLELKSNTGGNSCPASFSSAKRVTAGTTLYMVGWQNGSASIALTATTTRWSILKIG